VCSALADVGIDSVQQVREGSAGGGEKGLQVVRGGSDQGRERTAAGENKRIDHRMLCLWLWL
jgi:hypothetical protein